MGERADVGFLDVKTASSIEPPLPRLSKARLAVRFHGQREHGIDDIADLRRIALSVLRAEGASGPIDVVFHGPESQRALNLQWRRLDRTTDVLSFPYGEPELFGELYIDPVLAAEQAVRYRHDLHRELCRLIVHGCLHLCGYDHHTTSERKEMRALENLYDPLGAKR